MHVSTSRSSARRERGAALVMFALLVPVVLGAASLALDVGWAAYVKKRAQSAADAAALAAVTHARQVLGTAGSPACGSLPCQAPAVCPAAAGALDTACKYASANAYTGGASNNRTITVSAGANSAPPSAPGSTTNYWVEVTVEHDMKSWFSGMASATGLHPKATAVAALTVTPSNASLYLLNRKTDCFVSALNIGLVCGEDFLSLGFNDVRADLGIYMASSNPSGIGLPNIAAGTAVGTLDVQAPFTRLMGQGGIRSLLGLASMQWSAPPQNGFPDGDMFTDPMAGRGQPPAPTGLTNRPILLGAIVGSLNPSNPTLLPPGNYYASAPLLGATGTPITITGNVKFGDGQNPPCGGFCEYVFHGGLVTGALSQVTFSPGRYIFAGAQAVAGAPGVGLSVGANSVIKDLTPTVNGHITQNTDAGEIFIFTDSHYSGLQLPSGLGSLNLPEARAGVMAGVNPTIVLHGLNGNHSAVPAALKKFAPVLIWQDQANTTLRYTPSGRLDRTCGGICSNILSVPGSQEMIIQASGGIGGVGTQFFGTIYGPRGSWLTVAGLLPGDHISGPYQIITGALQLAVNANLYIDALPSPPVRLESHLIR